MVREELYKLIPQYVQKIYSNILSTKEICCMVRCSFLDLIRPGDIASVIAFVKNGRDVWDQIVRMKALGAAAHKEKENKLRPLFTAGIGKKKEQGKNIWSKEGIKYFKQAETEWKGVYKDEKFMKIHYSGWEVGWKEMNGGDNRRGFGENLVFSYGNVDRGE